MSDSPQVTNQGVLAGLVEMIASAVVAKLRDGNQPRLLTVAEAAKYISLSERSVRSMIASGTLPATREGRAVRLDRQALDRWIEVRSTRS